MNFEKVKGSRYNLSPSIQKSCHKIIHTSSGLAATVGAGLAQIPLADNTVITPIQISMIISLGKVFDQKVTETVAKSLLASLIANFVGRGVAQVAWGWVPGLGNVTNATTAAAITESIGWLCVDHFYKKKFESIEIDSRPQQKDRDIVDDNTQMLDDWEDIKLIADKFINGEITIEAAPDEYSKVLKRINNLASKTENTSSEVYQYMKKLKDLL